MTEQWTNLNYVTMYIYNVYEKNSKQRTSNFTREIQLTTTGVYMLDFFCSGIQFYLLLSPYLCFISLLYLDLYVLGDDALIS